VSKFAGKAVNSGLKPGLDPCRHCGGLHFGSGLACPYLCETCSGDTRPDADNRCTCSKCPECGRRQISGNDHFGFCSQAKLEGAQVYTGWEGSVPALEGTELVFVPRDPQSSSDVNAAQEANALRSYIASHAAPCSGMEITGGMTASGEERAAQPALEREK
jgi:hypothetical protein